MEKIELWVKNNLKTATIVTVCIILFLCVRSCSRGNKIDRIESKIVYIQDSLNKRIDSLENVSILQKSVICGLCKDTAKLGEDNRYYQQIVKAQAGKTTIVNNTTKVVNQKTND